MTAGVVSGGWEFVWAAYSLSFAVFTLYSVSVISRWRRDRHSGPARTPERVIGGEGAARTGVR